MSNYNWLDEYLLSKAGVTKDFKEEWQWWRYLVGGKMFAATMHPSEKYSAEYAGRNLISLKCDPMEAEFLRETHSCILPGFYCDKIHWNSICLDGDIPDDLMRQMCDASYALVFSKLTKKAQREILGE